MPRKPAFSLTALSDATVAALVRVTRRGTHLRRGRQAAYRHVKRVLTARGWGDDGISQFWHNCCALAALPQDDEEAP